MREYKYTYNGEEKRFKGDFETDIESLLIDEEELNEGRVNIVELEKSFGKVYSKNCNIFNSKKHTTKRVTRYYVPAEAMDRKRYKQIVDYNPDFPPTNPIVEVRLQLEESSCYAYVRLNNGNCSFFELIDFALDEIKEDATKCILGARKLDRGGFSLPFQDEGGWTDYIDIEDNDLDIEQFISGIRLVEEVE